MNEKCVQITIRKPQAAYRLIMLFPLGSAILTEISTSDLILQHGKLTITRDASSYTIHMHRTLLGIQGGLSVSHVISARWRHITELSTSGLILQY